MGLQSPKDGSRRRIKTVCLLMVAGLLPVAGCATNGLPGSRLAARMRHAGEPTASVPSTNQPSSAAMLAAVPPEGNEGERTATDAPAAAKPLPPLLAPEARPQPYPSVRLAGDESASRTQPQPPPSPPPRLARLDAHPAGRSVVHAGQASFEQQVLRADVPVLVDFYATWCGPCKALAPTLEEVAAESPGARVVKVDIDNSPELAARYGVQSVPTLLVFKNGQVVAKQRGVVSKSRLMTMLDL